MAQVDFEQWITERNEALRTLDLRYARRSLKLGDDVDDEVLWLALHKARVNCTGVAEQYREESKFWLRRRGYSTSIVR
jgi:hypothetical protein